MSKSRRGLVAAGIAVAVVGAIGVFSTMNAGASQIPSGAPAGAGSGAAATTTAAFRSTPPATLPWGARPGKIKHGKAGATSRSLHDAGLAIAPARGGAAPRAEYAPKGRSSKNSFLKSESANDVKPPLPAGSPSASAKTSASPSSSISPTTTVSPFASTSSPAKANVQAVAATTTTTPPVTAPPSSVAPSGSASASPSASTPASAPSSDGQVHFLYGVASQAGASDALYATLSVAKPALADEDYHTLAEMAMQSADGQQIVEVGWTVDRALNGDDDPHLFVYHWVNRTSTCYNACGWVQYSANAKPGDTLSYGSTQKFGIQFNDNAWWISFGSEWIGYFPASLWGDQGVTFTQGGFMQIFGEVAAASDTPCTDMGNGLDPATDTNAARVASVGYLNGPTPDLSVRSTSPVYAVNALSTRTFRYGGPGSC